LAGLMKRRAHDRAGSADNWQELLKPLPFGGAATAEEIGAAVAFLASDRSAYTSGSVVAIDAGLSARATAFQRALVYFGAGDGRAACRSRPGWTGLFIWDIAAARCAAAKVGFTDALLFPQRGA
jgi:hypothetical protein